LVLKDHTERKKDERKTKQGDPRRPSSRAQVPQEKHRGEGATWAKRRSEEKGQGDNIKGQIKGRPSISCRGVVALRNKGEENKRIGSPGNEKKGTQKIK